MRRAVMLCVCAGLVACGGSSKKTDNPGPGGSSVNVTGANTFTASNAIGYSTGTPVTCTVDPGTGPIAVPTAVLAVFLTDVQGDVCTLLNAHQEKKGAGGVGLFITRGRVDTGTPAAIGPGTYPITSSSTLPQQDSQGNITFVGAFASKNAAGSCGAADIEAESGTITITSVSGGVISGSIDANLKAASGGGRITGTFTTTACALPAADLCGADDSPNTCVD